MKKNISYDLEIVLRLAAAQLGVKGGLPDYTVTNEVNGLSIQRTPPVGDLSLEMPLDDVLRCAVCMQYQVGIMAEQREMIAAFQEVAAVFFDEGLREM